ncbi:NXPE family member 4-like isoform X1 [Hyla sarda]|uniref:NXPE family member 4-like isoform X1 n=2 Tax=Hyla sarda TaxID=327740 RepID=UPI0024C23332|nr:NXPE family member 4-like isoform X1 [Hyla sarda]XP_056399922.1 NXPE family member 4-like isoform X1 [Hyla sarda]
MKSLLVYKTYVLSIAVGCFLVSTMYHQSFKKCSNRENGIILKIDTKKASEIKMRISRIFNHIDQRIPKVTLIDKDSATSATNSKVFIKTPQNRYCVGDQLTVQVDVYDHLGKRKSYGGDYLRARISNPDMRAGSSGRIEDLNNGTYHIHFTLFWEGKVVVTVFLMHPSEVVSALWKSRNSWYGQVDYVGKFTSKDKEIVTKCGFAFDKKEELCEYADHEDDEYFYCVKPKNFSCGSLTELKSTKTYASQLSKLENSLFTRSNVRVEIPVNISAIDVVLCNGLSSEKKEHCKTGMGLEYPSGHVMEEIWYPKGCTMKTYHSMEELNACMKGKFIYMFGDSTTLQWMKYFEKNLKTLKLLNIYESGWAQKHLGVDIARNIYVQWKRHGRPFVTLDFASVREERSIPREIDIIGGSPYTVIAFTIGVHFRLFPVHHYIRRLLNIRRAIERLLIRSPQTKVIIKTENTSEMVNEFEGMSDFYGYIHYFIMEIIFKDLNVGFVNGWDMTTAFNLNQRHPPEPYIRNEVNMLMTYICT